MNCEKRFALIGFLCYAVSAQSRNLEFSVKWGKEFDANKSTLQDIVGYDELGFYALKDRASFSGSSLTIPLAEVQFSGLS